MQAITAAADYLGGKYLRGCSLYVTLEPCAMCAGALYWSQVQRVIYAAEDPKRGYRQMGGQLHPKTEVHQGPLAGEAQAILQEFFKNRR